MFFLQTFSVLLLIIGSCVNGYMNWGEVSGSGSSVRARYGHSYVTNVNGSQYIYGGFGITEHGNQTLDDLYRSHGAGWKVIQAQSGQFFFGNNSKYGRPPPTSWHGFWVNKEQTYFYRFGGAQYIRNNWYPMNDLWKFHIENEYWERLLNRPLDVVVTEYPKPPCEKNCTIWYNYNETFQNQTEKCIFDCTCMCNNCSDPCPKKYHYDCKNITYNISTDCVGSCSCTNYTTLNCSDPNSPINCTRNCSAYETFHKNCTQKICSEWTKNNCTLTNITDNCPIPPVKGCKNCTTKQYNCTDCTCKNVTLNLYYRIINKTHCYPDYCPPTPKTNVTKITTYFKGNDANFPSERYGSAYFSIGNDFFLFGGYGINYANQNQGYLCDFWVYNKTEGFVHLKGSRTIDQSSLVDWPGGRAHMTYWKRSWKTWYFFGGKKKSGGYNDLWTFDATTYSFVKKKSDTASFLPNTKSATTNFRFETNYIPSRRYGAAGWVDARYPNYLYMFGGYDVVNGYCKDMWIYDDNTNQWMAQDGYDCAETSAVPISANNPGARVYHTPWQDNTTNKIYFFGGQSMDSTGVKDQTGNWEWSTGSCHKISPYDYLNCCDGNGTCKVQLDKCDCNVKTGGKFLGKECQEYVGNTGITQKNGYIFEIEYHVRDSGISKQSPNTTCVGVIKDTSVLGGAKCEFDGSSADKSPWSKLTVTLASDTTFCPGQSLVVLSRSGGSETKYQETTVSITAPNPVDLPVLVLKNEQPIHSKQSCEQASGLLENVTNPGPRALVWSWWVYVGYTETAHIREYHSTLPKDVPNRNVTVLTNDIDRFADYRIKAEYWRPCFTSNKIEATTYCYSTLGQYVQPPTPTTTPVPVPTGNGDGDGDGNSADSDAVGQFFADVGWVLILLVLLACCATCCVAVILVSFFFFCIVLVAICVCGGCILALCTAICPYFGILIRFLPLGWGGKKDKDDFPEGYDPDSDQKLQDVQSRAIKRMVGNIPINNKKAVFRVNHYGLKHLESFATVGPGVILARAYDPKEDRTVMVKIFNCTFSDAYYSFFKHVEYDSERLKNLMDQPHPNVVEYFGCYQDFPRIGFVTSYHARNLKQLMKRLIFGKKSMSLRKKVKILLDVAQGLEYLHGLDLVHRKLCLENIYLDDQNNCRIGNFMLTGFEAVETRERGMRTYGPYYQAPEITKEKADDEDVDFDEDEGEEEEEEEDSDADILGPKKRNVDINKNLKSSPESDVFAFGMLMYQLISERMNPFYFAENKSTIAGQIAEDPKFRPKILKKFSSEETKWYITLMKKCWMKKGKNRPTVAEIVEELDTWFGGGKKKEGSESEEEEMEEEQSDDSGSGDGGSDDDESD